jgi:hypothetical protein
VKYLKNFNESYQDNPREEVDISKMVGKNVVSIDISKDKTIVTFYCVDFNNNEFKYEMLHEQDCCEDVYLEDVVGDLEDLYTQIIKAEEVTNRTDEPSENSDESYTWTYYNLATQEGYVQFRWFGSSNGYYSESVSVYEYKKW